MNNTKIEKWRREPGTRCRDHLARGTLLWGTVYSTGASGAACLLAPVVTDATPSFTGIFLESLLIFPLCGAVSSYIGWRISGMDPAGRRRRKKAGRRNTIHRFTAYRRLARMRPRHA